jgi:hypothetical protein
MSEVPLYMYQLVSYYVPRRVPCTLLLTISKDHANLPGCAGRHLDLFSVRCRPHLQWGLHRRHLASPHRLIRDSSDITSHPLDPRLSGIPQVASSPLHVHSSVGLSRKWRWGHI